MMCYVRVLILFIIFQLGLSCCTNPIEKTEVSNETSESNDSNLSSDNSDSSQGSTGGDTFFSCYPQVIDYSIGEGIHANISTEIDCFISSIRFSPDLWPGFSCIDVDENNNATGSINKVDRFKNDLLDIVQSASNLFEITVLPLNDIEFVSIEISFVSDDLSSRGSVFVSGQ